MDNPLTRLHRYIDGAYDLDELRTLCSDLGVDYDNLPGETKSAKARELLICLGHKHQIELLFAAIRQPLPEPFELKDLYDALPAYAPSSRIPLQCPPRGQHFTGRDAELTQILADLQPGRSCRVYTNGHHPNTSGFSFGFGQALWSNQGDCGTFKMPRVTR